MSESVLNLIAVICKACRNLMPIAKVLFAITMLLVSTSLIEEHLSDTPCLDVFKPDVKWVMVLVPNL